jgi:hypothetical protein
MNSPLGCRGGLIGSYVTICDNISHYIRGLNILLESRPSGDLQLGRNEIHS